MPDAFESQPVCTFQADGGAVIPLVLFRLREDGEYRVIERERPFRPGAKLDTTGKKKVIYSLETGWWDGNEEPGVPQTGYLAFLNTLIASFDGQTAGTLKLPFRSPLRVRCKSYSRAEAMDERAFSAVSLVFWTDNEDSVTAASFTKAAPAVAAPLIFVDFEDAAAIAGLVSNDVVSLRGLLSSLTTALAVGLDVALAGGAVVNTVASIEEAFTNQTTVVGPTYERILTDPEAWYPARLLRRLAAQAYAAVLLPASTAPADVTTVITLKQDASLFDVAARYHQDVSKLMGLNPTLENALLVPAGTPLRIVSL